MHGQPEPTPPPVEPSAWRQNELYLWGVDLFNHGYWWEAHTAWESLWGASKSDPAATAFLQGLIQVAAALLKERAGEDFGVRKLAARANANLSEAMRRADESRFMGVDLEEFIQSVDSFFSGSSRQPPWLVLG